MYLTGAPGGRLVGTVIRLFRLRIRAPADRLIRSPSISTMVS